MTDTATGKVALRPASSFSTVEGPEGFWRAYQEAETKEDLLGLLFGYRPYCSSGEREGIIDVYLYYADHRDASHIVGEDLSSEKLCEQAYICLCRKVVRYAIDDIHDGTSFFSDGGWRKALHEKLLDFFSTRANHSVFSTRANYPVHDPCKGHVAKYLQRLHDLFAGRITFDKGRYDYTGKPLKELHEKTCRALVEGGVHNQDLWKFLVEQRVVEALPLLKKSAEEYHNGDLMRMMRVGGSARGLALTIIDLESIGKYSKLWRPWN